MTEKKGKRKYWRRRPRRTGGEEATGAAPGGPSAEGLHPQEGDRPAEAEPQGGEAEEARAPDAFPESPEASAPRQPEGSLTAPEVLDVVKAVTGEAAPPKSRRRRSRRRGKVAPAETGAETTTLQEEAAPGVAEEPAPVFPEGATVSEPATAGDRPEAAEGPSEAPAVQEGMEEERAPEGAAAGLEPRKGRRRSRRRGRRRGKGIAAAPGGEAASEGEAGAEEFAGGAEGTSSEEPAPAPEWRIGVAAEEEEPEEEAEEEAGEEPGKGPRKAMFIDGIHPEEIRVAIVSEGNLEYFEVENQRRKQFKGNIYKGKVVNVAPAIEAAFVEFGGGRHGFLPLNEYCAGALMEHLGTWNEGDKRPHLRPGTEILVQVTKEESSIKGAALTSYISIAGRYLVMMLGMNRYGISKKISGEKEREKIRKNMEKLSYPEHLGFIVRTVGAGQPLKNLKADMENLLKLWERTAEGARTQKAPALLYEEQDIVIRTLRDNYSSDVSEVMMNSPDSYRKAQAFFEVYYPKQKQKLKMYRQKRPLFFKFNLDEQIEKACARKVPLPSGGHIVIDRTEALWSIDVNSGRSARDRDIEDTAYRTNREAASEVARQLRVRDMGGLIVIDFIDMEHRGHIKDVEKTLKDALKADKAKSDVSVMGKFGLVAVSRQRMGISFYDVLLKGCEQCAGTGLLPTQDAATVRLLRRVHGELSKDNAKDMVVRVAPALLETLLNQKREDVTSIEKLCGARVTFVSDPSLSPASFAVGDETA